MNTEIIKHFLISETNVRVDDLMLKKLERYKELLLSWNEKFNLTRITSDDDILYKHFLDSLYVLKFINLDGHNIADFGTGAGFPGLVLAIVLSSSYFTLIESSHKKCQFLNEVVNQLNLKNVTVRNIRAEEMNKNELFDFALARAMTRLNILLELTIPFLKTDGSLIAYKLFDNEEEINEAQNALKILNTKIYANLKYSLLDSDNKRSLILIKKEKETKKKYPRLYKDIINSPL